MLMSEQEIKDELRSYILKYLNGEITREQYADITEPFYTKYSSNIEQTEFYDIFSKYIPDACIVYVDEPGGIEEEKEKMFRDIMERTYQLIKER